MPNRRRAMLMAAVCSVSLVAVPAAQAETLVAGLTDAYKNNPTLQQQRITQRMADEQYYTTLVQQLGPGPLTLQLNQGINVEQLDNITPAGFSGLSLTQNLSTGGLINRNLTRNEITLFRARDTLRQNEQSTMRSVINDYIQLKSAELNIEVARAQLTTSQRNVDNFQAQYDVGTAISSDVESARVSLLNAQGNLQQRQNTLATAKLQYAIDVGRMPDDDIEAPPELPNVPGSYEEALQLAMQWAPTWRAAVYNDRVAELNLADAKVKPLPTVRGTVSYGIASGEIRTGAIRDIPNKDALTAGVTVSVPIFSFGLNSSALRVAQEQRNSQAIALKSARDTLTQNVQNQWNSLVNARSQVEIAKASLQSQTLSTQGQRAQYLLGGILTTQQLFSAEDALRSSQLSFISQLTNLYTAEATLLQTIGLLDPRYLIPSVTPYDPLDNFEQLKSKFVIVPYAPAVTAVDSLFSPKLAPVAADAKLPDAKVDSATVLPSLTTMAPKPDEATALNYVLPKVPDSPPPLPAMLPIPVPPPIDTTGLQNGPPGGGRGGAPGGFGGGGGGRGG